MAWVLSLLDEAQLAYTPPVAILPLGTGNDLARALGWGGSAPGRPFVQLIEEVDQAQVALLDRWQVSFEHARLPSHPFLKLNLDPCLPIVPQPV